MQQFINNHKVRCDIIGVYEHVSIISIKMWIFIIIKWIFTPERKKKMKFELKYTVITEYPLLRIDVNDKHIITQLTYVPDEFKELGFLSQEEIINDLPSYVRKLQENGLSVDFTNLDIDENYRGVRSKATLIASNKKGESATVKDVSLLFENCNDPSSAVAIDIDNKIYEMFNKTKKMNRILSTDELRDLLLSNNK